LFADDNKGRPKTLKTAETSRADGPTSILLFCKITWSLMY